MVQNVLRLSNISSDSFVKIYQKNWMKCFNNLHFTHVSKSTHCATIPLLYGQLSVHKFKSFHYVHQDQVFLVYPVLLIQLWWSCYVSYSTPRTQSRNIRYLIGTKKLTRSEKTSRWANLKLQGAREDNSNATKDLEFGETNVLSSIWQDDISITIIDCN